VHTHCVLGVVILSIADYHFQPLFASIVKSKYRESVSASMYQSQKSVLRGVEMYHYDQPISPTNPCHFDAVYFSGIEMLGISL
jgi:hypothetical protein